MVVRAFAHISWETCKAYHQMLRVEGYYRSLPRAVRGWRFLLGFARDLAVSALPVLRRDYHPRRHPICTDEQNRIAVAWRAWHASGADAQFLSDEVMEQLGAWRLRETDDRARGRTWGIRNG